jgi:hypothetical protein
MAIEVELPDKSVAEFPDDMAEDKIQEAIKSHLTGGGGGKGEDIADKQGFTPRQRRAEFNTLAKYGEDLPVSGTLGQVAQAATGPAIKNIPVVDPLLELGQSQYASKPVRVLSGVAKGVVDLGKGFTSPVGIATTALAGPLSKAPAAVQKAISAAFAAQGGMQALDASDPLVKAVKDEDWGKASELATDIVGSGAQAVIAGTQAVMPEGSSFKGQVSNEVSPEAKARIEAIPKSADILPQAKAEAVKAITAEEGKTSNIEHPTSNVEAGKEPAGGSPTVTGGSPVLPIEGGEENAGSKQEAAAVHGDVRTQPGVGPGKVPIEKGGQGVQPPAKTVAEEAQVPLTKDVADIEKMDAKAFSDEMTRRGSLTPAAYKLGLSVTDPAHLEAIKSAMERVRAKGRAAKEKGQFDVALPEIMKGQFFREAYEAATGTGSAGDALRKSDPNYKPPLPEGKEGKITGTTAGASSPAIKTPAESGTKPSADKRAEILAEFTKKDDAKYDALRKAPFEYQNMKAESPDDYEDYHELYNVRAAGNDVSVLRKESGADWTFETDGGKTDRLPAERTKAQALEHAAEMARDAAINQEFEKSSRSGDADSPRMVMYDMSKHLDLPEGWSLKDSTSSESSYYWMLEGPDGEYYKLRISDHEPSIFREKEFGANDMVFYAKPLEPEKFNAAMGRMEAWIKNQEPRDVQGSGRGASTSNKTSTRPKSSPATGELPTESSSSLALPRPGEPESISREAEQSKAQSSEPVKPSSVGQKPQVGKTTEIGAGPGAATRPGTVLATDIGQFESNIPPLEKLADAVKGFPKQAGAGFKEKLRQWMDDVGIPIKDFAQRALVGAKAATARVVDAFTTLPKVTSMDRAVGQWNLEDTEGDIAARRFATAVKQTFPNRSKLRALSNYINAGGDKELLQRQAALTKDPELRKTYTDALSFGPAEEKLAREVRQYHDEMLATAMQAGALEEGLENYIHRYYPKESDPNRQRLEAALNTYRFTKNFSGFKRRFYDSDFEAEQAGLKPEKDAGKRILAYDQGFRKALTARAFVKDRYAATMPDGRPEIDVVGAGVPSKTNVETGKETPYLIKPKSKAGGDSPEDYRGDYVTFDHPAFRRWKWVGKDDKGKPILMEGEMAVHPDAVKKYRALFERSWFQKNPLGKALLAPSHFVKQTMLALSAFHPVQIGIHAMEHKVNPFKLVDLNTRDPAQEELIKGGLVVSDLGGGNHFSEGVGGSGLFGKLPIAGEMVKASQDWLFKDFIPRIKMTMALDALGRNRKTYAKEVQAGKVTDEQLVRLTARQANAAFGEQNYRAMFRHKGLQDVLRFAFLAPDFGEARLRFPLQALNLKYGREQQMALFLGAVGMFVAAKSAEKLMTGEMNLKKPFSVTYKNREYGLRNVASDLYHMITDPSGYLRNRLNPIYTRPALEMLSGRDAFGRKRTAGQQALDEAKQIVPISGRGLVEKDQKLWESFVNAIGLTEHRASAWGQAMKDVNAWKEKKGYTEPGEFVYDADKDPYSRLTSALTYGSQAEVDRQLDRLLGKAQGPMSNVQAKKIAEHYKRSLAGHPYLTGSKAHELEYVKGLDAAGKERYAAAKQERRAMWEKFVKAWQARQE